MRLKDESAAVWERYPEAYVEVARFVTDLGGADGVVLVLALVYWLAHREKGATVAAYATVAVGFVILVKALFGLPRPVPDPAMEVDRLVPLEDDPYGFPSGHALVAVVVYGGLACVFDRLRRPAPLAGIALLVVAVSLSRVVLRLHYLGDLVAGVALGAVVLTALSVGVGERPALGFWVGVGVSVPAVLVSGFEELALVGLGAALGGVVATRHLDVVPPLRSPIEAALLVVVGLGYVVVVTVLAASLPVDGRLADAGVVIVHTLLVAGIFLAPVGVHRIENARLAATGGQ